MKTRQLFLTVFLSIVTMAMGQNKYLDNIEAAKNGDANAQKEIGNCYLNGEGVAKDNAQAILWYRKAANQGNAKAQYNLGLCYENGYGVDKDLTQAVYWYRKSSEQGFSVAQSILGTCYAIGQGVTKDFTQAVYWFRKAAEQGDANAQGNLGACYAKGEGVTKDLLQAVFWFRKAAEQGDPQAQYGLGNCYLNGEGVAKDLAQAVYWYRKSAEQGNPQGQCNLGVCYANGYGVTKDLSEAVYWSRKAAEQGDAQAQYNLGHSYINGDTKDLSQALYWTRKAAEQGLVMAQSRLGVWYRNGFAVDKDYVQAALWYRKAADQGYAEAQFNLAGCYQEGWGVAKDYTQAVFWYHKAAEQGFVNAQVNLGICYYNGAGVSKDLSQAAYWFREASIRGDSQAAENLKRVEAEMARVEAELKTETPLFSSVDNDIYVNNTIDKNVFAVVIGNEQYKNEVEVPFANNDAKIFGEYVEKTLGVPHEQIKLVENASYNDLRIAINWITQAMKVCRGKGKAIIYYAGHGIPNESDQSAYLLPVDGIGNDPASGYSLKELYEKLGNVEAQSITVFLDACFSGSKREEGMLASARGVAIKVKPAAPKGNLIVFSAAQGDETAYPYKDKQHGMFTYFLLKKLQETKGDVSLGDLSDYLTEEVGRQSFIKNNKMQTPTVSVSSALEGRWRNIMLK